MNKLIEKYMFFSVAIVCMVFPLSLSAQESFKPIKFSGSNRIYGQYSNRQGTYSQIPANCLREELNLRLDVYGIPFTGNLFLTTEQSNARQKINSIGFSVNPQQFLMNRAKQEFYKTKSGKTFRKIMSTFSTIQIGICRPGYSPLVLNDIALRGVNVEFTPGIFYSAFATGKTKRTIQYAEPRQQTYEQKLIFGKIGVGKKNKSHFYLSFLHVQDDVNSMTPDSTFYVIKADTILLPGDTIIHNQDTTYSLKAPQENYVIGADARLYLFKKKLYLGGEFAASMMTQNMNAPNNENAESYLPEWAINFFKPNVSSYVDYAYKVKIALNLKTTKLSGSYRMIGPGFNSLGTSFLRNDFRSYEGRFSQSFLKRKMLFSAYFWKGEDNLLQWKNSTTTYIAWGVSATFRFKKSPYFRVSYSPYQQSGVNESGKTENKTIIINLSSGYNYRIKQTNTSTNFNYSYSDNKFNLDSLMKSYRYSNYSLYQNFNFKIPLTFYLSVSLNNRNYSGEKSNIYMLTLGSTYTAWKKWSNTIGVRFSKQKNINAKTGFYFNSSFPVWKLGQMNIRIEQNFYRDDIQETNNYNEFIARAILVTKF